MADIGWWEKTVIILDTDFMKVLAGAFSGVVVSSFGVLLKSKTDKNKQRNIEKSKLDGLIKTFIYSDIYSWRCSYLKEFYLNQFNHLQEDTYYNEYKIYDQLNEEHQNKALEVLQKITDCISSLGYLYNKDVSNIIIDLNDIGFSDEIDIMLETVRKQTPEKNDKEYIEKLKEIRGYSDQYNIEFEKIKEKLNKLNINVRVGTICVSK